MVMPSPLRLSEIRVVSWDIDGTMYALPALMSAFKRDLLRRMFSPDFVSAWRDLFQLLRFKRHMDKVRRGLDGYRVPPVRDRERVGRTQAEMYGRILPRIGIQPGVLELMSWFRERGIIQVAFSDYRPSTKLTALGLDHFFDVVYAGEDIGYLKPAPEPFAAIVDAHQIEARQLLHIGDRADTDGAGAAAAGTQCAVIGTDYSSADELLKTLRKENEQ